VGRPKGYKLSQETRDRMSASALKRHESDRKARLFLIKIENAVMDGNRKLAHEILDEYIGELEQQ
jgi:hypothetical protein